MPMKLDRLVALLPCSSLEDLDLQRRDEDAEQLLSAWSSLWHPALLAAAKRIPVWQPADTPPSEPCGSLFVIPDCCATLLPDGWIAEAEQGGAWVLRNFENRDQMVAAALDLLRTCDEAASPYGLDKLDREVAADFLALGYCHIQVELLTRKMRYSSNLDEQGLQTAVLAAAGEALVGNGAAARGHLQTAFDRLHEAREYYYPIDTTLLDLTLLAHGTYGEPFRNALERGLPQNVLCSGEVIEAMANRAPDTLACLRQALADDRVSLVGGEFRELPLPLLGPEPIALELSRGLAVYERHLGRRPTVFGRRPFGLTPGLPQILDRLGFTAAFHCTLDDGRFPTAQQGRFQWEGLDGSTVEALGTIPLDAGRATSFLQLAEKLGDSMGMEQTGVVILAHWPGRVSRWYDDLQRIAAYGSVLGKLSTLGEYFSELGTAGRYGQYQPDEYRSPYLMQEAAAGRRDPLSRWVRYFQRCATLDAWQAVCLMEASVRGATTPAEQEAAAATEERLAAAIQDALLDEDRCDALDEQLARLSSEPLRALGQSLVGSPTSTQRGTLIVNPWSFAQPSCNAMPGRAVVDVPAMGFAWMGAESTGAGQPAASRRASGLRWFGLGRTRTPPPLAEAHVLRNEFCEIHFDPHTGAIRSISDDYSRDPRVGQQIALRQARDGVGGEADYSIMAADTLTVTSAGPVLGEMVARGRLVDHDGRRLAGFQQTTRVWRGSRVIELSIELDVDRPPGPNPWESYYAVRFAWKDASAALYRDVNLATAPTELAQFESPHFLDVRRGNQRTTLLFGGLPYHRRFGRKLDTLLVVHGETARHFRLGIGIDVPQPMAAATAFLARPLVLDDRPPPPSATGWLFHLDCRNVLATHWAYGGRRAPRSEAEGEASPTGFRVRLLETEGRSVRVGLRSFRAVAAAWKTPAGDMPAVELPICDDRVEVPIGPYQWVEVEVDFQ
ncbi:MAG: hypothetical protein ABFC63_02015 [Thermoguttaceae bacterium]